MKIDIIKFLIKEIEEEKKLLELVMEDEKQALEKAENNKQYDYWEFIKYEGRQPSKSRVKENCKKARQLLLEISKEI